MLRKLESMSDWLSLGTEMKIDEMAHYLDTLKSQLEIMAEDYTGRLEAQAKELEDEEAKQGFYEWSEEEYWRYKDDFPRILLNSFHVSAYSLLESEILSVARRVGQKKNQVFDVSDVRSADHSYLKSAVYYIEKLTGVNGKTLRSWNGLAEGQILRNVIVHANGRFTKDKYIELAKKYKVLDESHLEVLSVRPIRQISLTHGYCLAFLNMTRDFFAELYLQMKAGNHL